MTSPDPADRRPRVRAQRGDDRMPRSLRALAGAGVLAVALMAFAPQVGALDPRDGHLDAVSAGTDGTVHYEAPETSRRVDVQLVGLDPVAAPAGTSVPAGREVVAVRLRLAADRGADIAGCRIELRSGARSVPADALPVPGTGCDAGAPLRGPGAIRSTTYVSVPAGTRLTSVRVQWEPPAYADLPAI